MAETEGPSPVDLSGTAVTFPVTLSGREEGRLIAENEGPDFMNSAARPASRDEEERIDVPMARLPACLVCFGVPHVPRHLSGSLVAATPRAEPGARQGAAGAFGELLRRHVPQLAAAADQWSRGGVCWALVGPDLDLALAWPAHRHRRRHVCAHRALLHTATKGGRPALHGEGQATRASSAGEPAGSWSTDPRCSA